MHSRPCSSWGYIIVVSGWICCGTTNLQKEIKSPQVSYRVHITLRYFECPQNFPPKVASTGLLVPRPPSRVFQEAKTKRPNGMARLIGVQTPNRTLKSCQGLMNRLTLRLGVCHHVVCFLVWRAAVISISIIIIWSASISLFPPWIACFNHFILSHLLNTSPFLIPYPSKWWVTPQLTVQKTLLSQDVVLQMLDRQLC